MGEANRKYVCAFLYLSLVLVLIGCSSPQPRSPRSGALSTDGSTRGVGVVPWTVECTAGYRASVTIQNSRRETVSLSTNWEQKTIEFSDLAFHAQYWNHPIEGRGLKVWVTIIGTHDEVAAQLYQFDRSQVVENQVPQFGFTGLGSVYHPQSRAELQYSCKTV